MVIRIFKDVSANFRKQYEKCYTNFSYRTFFVFLLLLYFLFIFKREKELVFCIVNCGFSLWKNIFLRSCSRIYLGPLLFNIYTNNIFFQVDEAFLSNHTNSTALYYVHKKGILNQSILKKNFICLQKWFHNNYMVLNPGKYYCMNFGSNTTKKEFVLENGAIASSAEEYVVLGITINFYSHFKQLCKQVANKPNALTGISPYLSHNRRRFIYSSFFTRHLRCFSLIWTICSRKSNHLINKLQERYITLRIIYNDCDSSFSEILEMSNESTIHIKNMNVLMTELYKFSNNLSPRIMNNIFQKQENCCSLRNPRSLVSKRKFTTSYGIDTMSFRRPQIWQHLPQDIKISDSLNLFKSKAKTYGALTCHFKLCKTCIHSCDN